MNLLITGAWTEAKNNIHRLEKMGHVVIFLQYEKDELPCEYDWVEGVICNGLFLNHQIEKFTNLKYIQLTSVGYDRVPMEYVKEHNIEIYNAKGVYSIPMAEFALTGVLSLYKQMRFFTDNQNKHIWEKHRGLMELYGKMVCIIGCGDVGTECAKRFAAFGCKVVGINRTLRQNGIFEKIYSMDEIDAVISNIDILVLAVPAVKQTMHLIDAERIQKLKSSAVIVNIARGSVLDMTALIENLDRIGGAVLDVFEEEPINIENPLWDMTNVILTPHNSFVGDSNLKRLTSVILQNFKENENEENRV